MKKSEAITIQAKDENWHKFPVFVWAEGDEFVTEVDGQVLRTKSAIGIDLALDSIGIPSPRNIYFVDEPDYEAERLQKQPPPQPITSHKNER